MFKKFMCVALSLMMVLCTVSVTGFAASFEDGNLVASHVTFTDSVDSDGNTTVTAQISVTNTSATESGSAAFWIGKYDKNGVLVESAKETIAPAADEIKTSTGISVTIKKDEADVTVKAYIWEKMVGGKAIATPATYKSESTEVLYATKNGEVWADFSADKYYYEIELDRTEFELPTFKFYAKDNATQIIEPAYKVGSNEIVVKPAVGAEKKYVIKLSYKAPEFKNYKAADNEQYYVVTDTEVTVENFNDIPEAVRLGTHGYTGYPFLRNGVLDTAGCSVVRYLNDFGYDEGELYVFQTAKSKWNAHNWYSGGVGKYDGTNDSWYISFDLEAAGTMYLLDSENKGNPSAVANGYTKVEGKNIYKKHFEAGETVKVPAYGWHEIFGSVEDNDDRTFWNPTMFLFGYDDGWETPVVFDKSDAKLKSLTYTADGTTSTVTGFAAADEGEKTYNVSLPYGTSEVSLKATANESHATVTVAPETITLDAQGKATAVVTVKSFDETKTNTYTVNFAIEAPAADNAFLKTLEYKVGETTTAVSGFNKETYTYNVTLPEKTTSVTVQATAEAFDKATVNVNQATIADRKGTATVVVTAEDGTTSKTYTINFTVTMSFEEMPNKIVDFVANGEAYKTDNHSYQSEAESAVALGKLVLAENLQNGSLKYYERDAGYSFKNVSEDMKGATYIRSNRNYNKYTVVKTQGEFTKDGVSMTSDHGETGGFRMSNYDTNAFYTGDYTGIGDKQGWYEFKVTSDCTVVVTIWESKTWQTGLDAGWVKSTDNKTNYLGGGQSYYKTFKAGDTVKVPNYGLKPSGTDVVYKYKDATGADKTYTVDSTYNYIIWDAYTVAVKWSAYQSNDATLKSIKVNGSEIIDGDKTDYVVDVAKGTTSATLEVAANDKNATVSGATETIAVGSTATITVTAEDGKTTKTYKVTVREKASNLAELTALSYKVGDGAAVAVPGFAATTKTYTVPAFDYVAGGVTVTLSATPIDGATVDTSKATVTVTDAASATAVVKVTSEDATVSEDYKVTFSMNKLVPTAVVEGTEGYKALLNDGKYTKGNYLISLGDPVTFKSQKQSMLTWDENGLAKNKKYIVKVDGVDVGDGEKLYSNAMKLKADLEAEGKTVELVPGSFNYNESQVQTNVSTVFGYGNGHNFGTTGSVLKNAYQVMTHRGISPGRVSADYKDTAAAKTWLTTDSNYLFTVTPNTKATVYVVMQQGNAGSHKQYQKDGWTFLDYSSEFTTDKLNALPDSAIIETYRTLPAGIKRQWWMVDPTYSMSSAPLSLVKVQYDTGSDTYGVVYSRVWYKTVEAGETLSVPTIGSIVGTGDTNPLKAFVVFGEHDTTLDPVSKDATLKSLTVDGTAVSGFVADKTDYTVNLPYGSTVPTADKIVAVANDAKASVATVTISDNVATIKVTAQSGDEKTYKITFNIAPASTDATLKKLSYGTVDITLAEGVTDYSAEVESVPAADTIVAVVNDENATITSKSFDETGKIYTIVVTAQSGATKTYKITFVTPSAPTLSKDATLKALSVAGTPVSLEAAKFDYVVEIIDGYVTVVATPNSDKATVVITNASGVAATQFVAGDIAKIVVSAEDTSVTQLYTITFKAASTGGGIEDGGEDTSGVITDIDGTEDGGEY